MRGEREIKVKFEEEEALRNGSWGFGLCAGAYWSYGVGSI